jgi:hypothetical protein
VSFEDIDDTTEAHERRIVRCRSCRARIVWLDTNNNRRMPVDADTVDPEDTEYEQGKHVCHFTTCPQADEWRRRR